MKLKGLQYGIIFLVLFTAAMHLGAALDRQLFPDGPDPLFTLNGLGYLGLLGAYFLPIPFFRKNHAMGWWALFIYVIITIVAWIIIWVVLNVILGKQPFFAHDSLYGVPAKIAEVVLLVLLRRDRAS